MTTRTATTVTSTTTTSGLDQGTTSDNTRFTKVSFKRHNGAHDDRHGTPNVCANNAKERVSTTSGTPLDHGYPISVTN